MSFEKCFSKSFELILETEEGRMRNDGKGHVGYGAKKAKKGLEFTPRSCYPFPALSQGAPAA